MKKSIFLSVAAAFAVAIASPARATVIIDVTEAGGDVVFTATGSLDLTGAAAQGGYSAYGQGVIPGGSNWYVAPGPGGPTEGYALTAFDGPFGTSTVFFTPPSSTSGDNFFIWGQSGLVAQVGVPVGYTSGDAISSGMVFSGATLADFTLIPGSYTFTLPNDTITLNIGAPVPEPGTLALLGLGLASLGFVRRKKA